MRLVLLATLLLVAVPISPAATQTPSACERECKRTYQQCVKDTGDRPVCEAGCAFCLECCTGGC
jgi:hypothetical protein